jgi:protein-disulfide isomerase
MATRTGQKERLRAERLRKEAEAQAKERRRRLLQLGGVAALGALCVVAVLIVVSQSGGGSSGGGAEGGGAAGAGAVARELQGIPQDGTVLGDPNAKVRVIEYADLQCPICKEFSSATTPGLIEGAVRKGTASYELRQFTIIGPDSETAAKAALAAGEQGRYWNFVELFYRNQGGENSGYVTDSFLESVARGAGVPDLAKWNADRRSGKWDAALSKVQSDAESLGINSTPSIVVEGPGGRRVVGAGVIPVAQIERAIKSVE